MRATVIMTAIVLVVGLGTTQPPSTRGLSPHVQKTNFKCGFKPFPPFGCQVGPCICDSSGNNCEWQMICR
jgi:hypothetical protein